MVNGISIIICAHNSRSRISPTLAHLAAQEVPSQMPWEVLLIDNGSTDDTAAVAQKEWTGTVPLRIIHELELGLSYARWRGIHEAQYEIVSFVDDDKWVCTNWVELVAEIMTEHPEVGACGGEIEGAFECEPPVWFHKFRSMYAITGNNGSTGEVDILVGAGLSIRRNALMTLEEQGFHSLLTDRKGTSLSSGGDTELCIALILAGWRLWFDVRLHMQHYMPTNRLNWKYTRRLARATGISGVMLDGYAILSRNGIQTFHSRHTHSWYRQLAKDIGIILKHPAKLTSYLFNNSEGHLDVIWMERRIGRVLALCHCRSTYNATWKQIYEAQWVAK